MKEYNSKLRRVVPVTGVIGGSLEIPEFYEGTEIVGLEKNERGHTRFQLRRGIDRWRSVPASSQELERYDEALKKAEN